MSGQRSHLTGLAAEDAVARHYARTGAEVVARRWRGPGGEIDLILREKACVVFVEVKSSRDHARALAALSDRQIARIRASAEAFLATEPGGGLIDARFDVALVDGTGRVEIVPNALA